jgi:thioredoxin reductase
MPQPARNTLAIVGAGPIGIEAALAALDQGFDVHLFEQGEVGSHPIAWGHVRMFTPWRMNVGPSTAKQLQNSGWTPPDAETFPTGMEFVETYLQPAGALDALKDRLHAHAQVVQVGRRGMLKGDHIGTPARREQPFRLLVRDQGGRENFLHAFAVIDASGVYANPNHAGEGGLPARQELYLAPQMTYHIPDVLGAQRGTFAGKRTMVIGAGASAATTVSDLALLAEASEGTSVLWVTRKPDIYAEIADDPLTGRRGLYARARELADGASPAVTHVGGVEIEGFEFNSATHRYRVTLVAGDEKKLEEVDQVVVNTGFAPDRSIYRELQIHECYASEGLMKLSAALMGQADCLDAPAVGVDVLTSPEPDFYVLGHKSYGRSPHFLLEHGYKQVAEVVAKLAKDQRQAATA